ncbi:lipid-binding SYLF domain-containing protein [Massilia oculi]|uniref:Ysc84 actin-binding domain-containing protein n=1 Tax=Massilia oculi TaxID=945844 RepID=A0A2S2DNR1_9BURK|nr:lipid-binding SYLF domain-containing protein [Massilia oculi]AWL06994.1 hypothetical protein DIR46_22900 [Massilia oculi]
MNPSMPPTPDTVRARPPLPPSRARRSLRRALLAVLCTALPAFAQAPASTAGAPDAQPTVTGASEAQRKQTAARHVDDAARAAQTMAADPKLAALLKRARGVYILPRYGRAALGVGAEGGAGVLLARRADGSWGDPAFFNTGAIGIGLQAGAETGPVAFVLMNQRAVDHFRSKNNFSISADAGLTIVTYARLAEGSTGGDIVAWSGSKGLFANALTVAIQDIRFNQGLTDAYYGQALSARQVLEREQNIDQAAALRKALGGADARTSPR